MRIVKVNANGEVGADLLKASHLRVNRSMMDEYTVVLDAAGLDDNGDPIAFRVILTRGELNHVNDQIA